MLENILNKFENEMEGFFYSKGCDLVLPAFAKITQRFTESVLCFDY